MTMINKTLYDKQKALQASLERHGIEIKELLF